MSSIAGRLDQPLESFPPLTPGQLQLLSFARAILRTKPKLVSIAELQRKEILLLDEATSSLDPVAEALVQNLIQEHFTNKGHTVIIVSKQVTSSRFELLMS
jgi:ABC-type multidrug transport system fused ATPase/permease subunit